MNDVSNPGQLCPEPLSILLVEDNPGHAELVRRNLVKNRVANGVNLVPDGEAALDFLFHRNTYSDLSKSPRPHLILLDLRLPKVDGLEVLKTIKESDELKEIPVVILTTSKAEEDITKSYQYQASSYLLKPIDFIKFAELMKSLGFYWLACRHFPWAPDGESKN